MFDRRGRKRHKSGKTKIVRSKKKKNYNHVFIVRVINLPFSLQTLENFEFIKVLGKGNFAKVILCREIATNDLYAIKSMKKDVIIEENEVTHVFNERNVLKKTKHPFLLVSCASGKV